MNQKDKTRLAGGILLILIGIGLFLVRFLPVAEYLTDIFTGWPMVLIGLGGAFLIIGLLSGTTDLAVPACILVGLGGIFLYQNNTQDWESWSYMWALIPGFAGIGVVLSGLLKWRLRYEIREGLKLILISAVLFILFGALFGEIRMLGDYWPIVLILLGLWIVVRNLMRNKKPFSGS